MTDAEKAKQALDELKTEETKPTSQIDAEAIATAVAKAMQQANDLAGKKQKPEPAAPQPKRLSMKEQLAQLSPEQRAQLDVAIAANPTGTMVELAGMIADERMATFAQQANPFMQQTGDLFVDQYITRKSATEPYFAKIEPLFREELEDVDLRDLITLPAAQRERQLNLRWQTAEAKVYRTAQANAPRNEPPNLGGGGSGGGNGTKPVRGARVNGAIFTDETLAKDPGLTALVATLKARGNWTDEDTDAIQETYLESI